MDHTLVIPTYNRPELVRRLVAHYLKRSTPIQLLVLDSSKSEIAKANAEWFKDRAPHVRYEVYPDTLQPGAKLAQGLQLVKTTYASFCGDDDLVFPQGLADADRFLSGNPDYVCAHGLYLNFRVGDQPEPDVVLPPGVLLNPLHLHVWREYGGPGNEAGHAGARIFRLFQSYESLFYAAFRTNDLRDIFSRVQHILTLHYQELFQSVATLIKGKVKRLPCLYAARQSIEAAQPERDNWQTFYWFASNTQELLNHYVNYCDDLWHFYQAYAAEPRLDRKAFQTTLDLSHAVYFSAGCPPAYFYSVLQHFWPQDGFVQPGRMDVFSQLGAAAGAAALPSGPAKWTVRSVLSAARVVLRAARYAPHRHLLNWRARRLGGTPWDCRLPWNLRWLAGNTEFRDAYLELCLYLDSR
jgi:glycosyltransferase domain-containing protein